MLAQSRPVVPPTLSPSTLEMPSINSASGYVLVLGSSGGEGALQTILWEHGVPAYTPKEHMPLASILSDLGAPSLILLNLEKMETSDMIEIEEYRVRHDVPVLCIAPANLQQARVQAFLQVANDFVCTPYDSAELLLRIMRTWRQGQASQKSHSRLRLDAGKRQFQNGNHTVLLSPTEYAILQQLNRKIGQAVDFEALSTHIEGESLEQKLNTLRVHIRRLRQKVEPNPRRPEYIQTVRGVGYRLSMPISVDERH
jgi:DNA-binding response OmpR family regulator